MTVRFSMDGQACSIEIPSGVASRDEVHRILDKAVPISVRGKKWNQFQEFEGFAGFVSTYYEAVVVTEDIFTSDALNKNPGASVIFKDKKCGWKANQDEFDRPPEGKPGGQAHHTGPKKPEDLLRFPTQS